MARPPSKKALSARAVAGWETRRANEARELREARKAAREASERATRGWETRRAKEAAATALRASNLAKRKAREKARELSARAARGWETRRVYQAARDQIAALPRKPPPSTGGFDAGALDFQPDHPPPRLASPIPQSAGQAGKGLGSGLLPQKAGKKETKRQRDARKKEERKEKRRARAHLEKVRKFDAAELRREAALEKKIQAELSAARTQALGGLWSFEGVKEPLHGSVRSDWYLLKAKRTAEDDDWRNFLERATELGMSGDEAADEWFSPDL